MDNHITTPTGALSREALQQIEDMLVRAIQRAFPKKVPWDRDSGKQRPRGGRDPEDLDQAVALAKHQFAGKSFFAREFFQWGRDQGFKLQGNPLILGRMLANHPDVRVGVRTRKGNSFSII
jgi:hypothetical protein